MEHWEITHTGSEYLEDVGTKLDNYHFTEYEYRVMHPRWYHDATNEHLLLGVLERTISPSFPTTEELIAAVRLTKRVAPSTLEKALARLRRDGYVEVKL